MGENESRGQGGGANAYVALTGQAEPQRPVEPLAVAQDRLPEFIGVTRAADILGVSVATYYRRLKAGDYPHWAAAGNKAVPSSWALKTAGPARVTAWLDEEAAREAEDARPGPLGLDGVARLDNHEARIAALEATVARLDEDARRTSMLLLEMTQRTIAQDRREATARARVSPDESRPG